MQTIGLTGGIGAGKSMVARILKEMGYPVYISDKEASKLMNSDSEIRKEIITLLGTSLYNQENKLNKPLLAKIIFENSRILSIINHIVHPRVLEDFQKWSRQQTHSLIFFESAILFEAGFHSYFKPIICVTAAEETRIQRVVDRDHTTTEKVKTRICSQIKDSEKCKYSDFIIYNDNYHPLLKQTLEIVQKIEKMNL